ncbi:MAG: M16 family metallopeptidase, partial [Granulosicoccaceae bacterium]
MSVGPHRWLVFFAFKLLLLQGSVVCAAPTQSTVLNNGLVVHLNPIATDSQHLDLRLILKQGAAHEQAGQRGWSHLIEHMAFNGTERFKAAQIRSLYQRHHLRLGRDVNAETGDQHTVYQLSVPGDNEALLRQNLELMVDWLSAMRFSAADLQREKRIVAAEALQIQTHESENQPWHEAFVTGAALNHTAIGEMGDVQSATVAQLKAFWQRGYRPDRAEVVLTGDFIPAAAMSVIRATLGRLFSGVAVEKKSSPEIKVVPPAAFLSKLDSHKPQVLLAAVAEGDEAAVELSLSMLALHLKLDLAGADARCHGLRRKTHVLSSAHELEWLELSAGEGAELLCLHKLTAAAQSLAAGSVDQNFVMQLFHRAQSERQRHQLLQKTRQLSLIADELQVRLLAGATPRTRAEHWQQVADLLGRADERSVLELLRTRLDQKALSLVVVAQEMSALDESDLLALWQRSSEQPIEPLTRAGYTLAKASARPAVSVTQGTGVQRSLRYANGAQVHLLQTDNIHDHFDVLMVREGGLLSLPSMLVSAAVKLPAMLPLLGVEGNSAADVQAGIREHRLGIHWFVENFRQGVRANSRGKSAPALFSLLHQVHLPGTVEFELPPNSQTVRAVTDQGRRQLHRVIWRTLYDLGEPVRPEVPKVLNAKKFAQARESLF